MSIPYGVQLDPSVLPTLRRITELAKLPNNWDGEDAEAPTARAIAAADYLVAAVAEGRERRGFRRVPPTTSSPIPDGGVQLEWRGVNARIDVQANPDGSYGFLVKWGSGSAARYEEADEASLDSILERIDHVLDA